MVEELLASINYKSRDLILVPRLVAESSAQPMQHS